MQGANVVNDAERRVGVVAMDSSVKVSLLIFSNVMYTVNIFM